MASTDGGASSVHIDQPPTEFPSDISGPVPNRTALILMVLVLNLRELWDISITACVKFALSLRLLAISTSEPREFGSTGEILRNFGIFVSRA